MQTILDFFASHGWIVEVFLIILLTAGLRLLLKVSLDRLARQAQKTNNYWDDALVEAGRRPAGIAVWALGGKAWVERKRDWREHSSLYVMPGHLARA